MLQSDAAVVRRICRLWKSTGLEVDVAEKAEDVAVKLTADVAVIGADEFDRDTVIAALARFPNLRAVLWTAEPIERVLGLALEEPRISHILGRPDFHHTPADWELLMIARRLLKPREAPPPLAAFLRWGATGFRTVVSDTSGIEQTVGRAQKFAETMGAARWVGEHLGELVHELLMNALYDAPVDAAGQKRFAHDRKAHVALAEAESTTFGMASDGTSLCVQVTDPFGRLERQHVFGGLLRGLKTGQMDQSNGGAGLGILLCHQATTALMYDVCPGQRTQVTAVIDLDLNRRDFRSRARSLHYFVTENS